MDPKRRVAVELKPDCCDRHQGTNDHDQKGRRAIADIELLIIKAAGAASSGKRNGARE
jgi:hypothetical protein